MGFYIETSESINDFLKWLSINDLDLISILRELPHSTIKLQHILALTSTGLNEEAVSNIQLFILITFQNTYLVKGELLSLIEMLDLDDDNTMLNEKSLDIILLRSPPVYDHDGVIDNVNKLNFADSPVISQKLTLRF